MEFAQRKYDVVAIGNAIVDVLSFVSEDFLRDSPIKKGIMTLIDEAAAERIYSGLGQSTELSGGSTANSAAGVAYLGGTAAFMGHVKDDEFGRIFTHDLNSVGVHYATKPSKSGKATAKSFVMVTSDAERTMLTYLGACTQFNKNDVDEELLKQAKVLLIEGYLWDEPKAKEAIHYAIELAKKHGVKVALSLSDPFCVGRYREEFVELLADVDILFCNEDEAKSLFEVDDVKQCIEKFAAICEITSITRGKRGALIISGDFVAEVAAEIVDKPVDTTGAGDLYASGFLYGLTQGKKLAECGRIGCKTAGQIIKQLGARIIAPAEIKTAAK